MRRLPIFLILVLGVSIALLAIHFALFAFDFMSVGFYTYCVEIDVLDKLHEFGLGDLVANNGWPEPTRLGANVFLGVWWLFYFVVVLIVALLIRRFRFPGTQSI